MFIDQEKNKELELAAKQEAEQKSWLADRKNFFAIILFLLLLSSGAFVFYLFYHKKLSVSVNDINSQKIINRDKEIINSSTTTGGLPLDFGNGEGSDIDFYGIDGNNLRAEEITFGYFFEKKQEDFIPQPTNYSLPLNIKSDIINYYDAARKIDFTEYISKLNQYGFAVLDSRKGQEYNDFFSMYQFLDRQNLPIIITTDFLIYYFQNTLKNIYKEIEKNIFYDLIRDINEQFLNIASTKYKKRLEIVGPVNDLVLEGRRLEAAFFAVALSLLAPSADQVQKDKDKAEGKFTAEESVKYYFAAPDYLKYDVEKEVALIREAKITARSPVFLYNIDYSRFKVPDNYKNNPKLSNFYLALKWLNSVFPLYFTNEDCPSCLLDYDDWTRSFAAAFFIADDFEQNQDLKNRWAVVYKFIAFFSGLRQDLTYLHYNQIKRELFGSDFDIEQIFLPENHKRKENIDEMFKKISQLNFSRLEGAFDRNNKLEKPYIGMRLLQEPYWPNDYIFSTLIGQDLKLKNQNWELKDVFTACRTNDKSGEKYRCRAFGLDIINLIKTPAKNDYFLINSAYEKYDQRVELLKKELSLFDNYAWNNNIYWINFNQLENVLFFDRSKLPVFMQSDEWQREKDFNFALGAWMNLHLPEDKHGIYLPEKEKYIGYFAECNNYNYVEPNFALINDFIARNLMLIKMLTTLKVSEKTNAVAIELKSLNDELEKLLAIVKKELSGQLLNSDDCDFIRNFAISRKINSSFPKNYYFNFKNGKLQVSLDKVKLLAIVNQFGDQKALVFGPIFNYSEK